MSKSSKTMRLPRAPRKTRWWAYVILLVALALAWPAYRYNASYRQLNDALNELSLGNIDVAIDKLEVAAEDNPQNAEATYWLAVAHRRAGHLVKFDQFLQRAKDLNYPPDEVARQLLLARIQSGEMEGIEEEADQIIADADRHAGRRFELFVDEFYEARAQGFLANYRLVNAEVTLTHWIEARPSLLAPRIRRAEVKERENDSRAAEQEYREIIELDPASIESRIQLARLLMFNQKVHEAAKQYEICLATAPEDVRIQLGLAECEYREGGKSDLAKVRLEKLVTQKLSSNDRGKALFLLGEIARSRGQQELAIKYLTEATSCSSTLGATPFHSLSAAYASLRNREQAEKYSKLADHQFNFGSRQSFLANEILQNPTNAALRYEQGRVYSEEGYQDEAAGWWAMAIRLDPDHVPSQASLADYYLSKGEREKSEYHRTLAAQSAPQMFARLWRELSHENLAEVRDGLPWLEKCSPLAEQVEFLTQGLAVVEGKDLLPARDRLLVLARHPQLQLPALTVLGEAYLKLGNFAAARQAFQKALAMEANDPAANWGMQKYCGETAAFAEMEKYASKAAEYDVADFRPHRALGNWHQQHRHWSQAIQDYQESLRRNPNQIWSKAVRDFEETQHPKNSHPEKDEVLLSLAECQAENKEYDEAIKNLKDIPSSARKGFVEARCNYLAGDIARAKKILDATRKLSESHVPSLLLRAEIALSENETDVSENLLTRAIRIEPDRLEPHRQLAILLRSKGELAAARAEETRANELAELEAQFAELSNKASHDPLNISWRREMAIVSKKLGRDAQASHWERVVAGMSQITEHSDEVPRS